MPDAPASQPTSKQDPACEQVFLTILRVADKLTADFADFLKMYDLTPVQYNVLRILRGAGPDGVTCHDIATRLITRDPDVTRLLDRLEQKSLTYRQRSPNDRRVVKAILTPQGLALVNQLDHPVRTWHAQRFGHLSATARQSLLDLLTQLMTDR